MAPPAKAAEGRLRRRIIVLAAVATVLAFLHFTDHVIRGEYVVHDGLNPDWNHSGWPFDDHTDKPYLFPVYFVVVMGLLLGGLLAALRGRVFAGYWLSVSMVLTGLLLFIHFVGASSSAAETPSVIAMSHHNSVGSTLALVDLFGLFAVLAALAFNALRARRVSGQW